MTSKERILKAIKREKPDHVPVVPDLFQMVPIRLSGKPSWNILVYQDPPIWKAITDAYRYYEVDAFYVVSVPLAKTRTVIVYKDDNKMISRDFTERNGKKVWSREAVVYRPTEPTARVSARSIGLPDEHDKFEIVTPEYSKIGKEFLDDARAYMKDDGIVAPMVGIPSLAVTEDSIFRYYDEHEAVVEEMRRRGEAMMKTAELILSWKPDVLAIGNSGLMVSNPPHIFREIGLEWLKKVTLLAKEHGTPTLMHCCGPERTLVEIAATETDLSAIEPLEIPPMGDCNLKEIKEKFGHLIALKGNLHTTDIMLNGTPKQVEDACKKAIDDAAEGGGFILSTGDQTPRDVTDETIRIMKRVGETYGRY